MNAVEYYRSIKADRYAWADAMPDQCMNCLRSPGERSVRTEAVLWLETHEICSRAHLPNAWAFRGNYLRLCHWCHTKVAAMPHSVQLAIKLRADPVHYDLADWLRRRNPKAMKYVTEDEVRVALIHLLT